MIRRYFPKEDFPKHNDFHILMKDKIKPSETTGVFDLLTLCLIETDAVAVSFRSL